MLTTRIRPCPAARSAWRRSGDRHGSLPLPLSKPRETAKLARAWPRFSGFSEARTGPPARPAATVRLMSSVRMIMTELPVDRGGRLPGPPCLMSLHGGFGADLTCGLAHAEIGLRCRAFLDFGWIFLKHPVIQPFERMRKLPSSGGNAHVAAGGSSQASGQGRDGRALPQQGRGICACLSLA